MEKPVQGARAATKVELHGRWWVVIHEVQGGWRSPIVEFPVDSEAIADLFIKWVR